MKTNLKKIMLIGLVAVMIILSACGSLGIIRQQSDETGEKTAYLYSRRADGKKEYCLSILDSDEALDMEAEPNVYKSKLEFDFEWLDDMLAVLQNKKETPVADELEVDGIPVIFGQIYEVE